MWIRKSRGLYLSLELPNLKPLSGIASAGPGGCSTFENPKKSWYTVGFCWLAIMFEVWGVGFQASSIERFLRRPKKPCAFGTTPGHTISIKAEPNFVRRGCRHQLEASGRRWVPFRLQGGLYTRILKRGTVYVLLSRLLALRVAGFGLKTPVLHSRELRGSLRCRIDGFRPGARGLFWRGRP